MLKNIISDIHSLKNPEKIKIYQGFFKTGKGEYGEGDIFLGLNMPQTRALVKKYAPSLTLDDINTLLADKHHEIRMAGVLSLVYHARDIARLPEIVEHYLTARPGVNNWDLVDVSAPDIIGVYLQECLTHEERIAFIDDFLHSKNLWVNRMIIIASFHQIKQGNGKLTIYIAERMLSHKHDLIHKAVGWMLREVGKRCSMDELRGFLDQYSSKMPRTMLRYAIEKMDEPSRKHYMNKKDA